MRRLALLAAVLVALLDLPLDAQTSAPAAPSRWDRTARSILSDLVGMNTTESSGNTAEAARAMAAKLRAAGFPDSDVVVVEHAPRKGNLIARLRGRSATGKPIVLLSHLDVVEARAEDWTLPPFPFVERDGTFYGRGVADDKDDAAIGLTILLRLKEEGFVPDRDIVVAMTADEEGGPNNGVEWLVKNRPELLNAELVLNEGGGGRVREGVKISHDIQASEKKVQNFRLEVTNPGGHSSVPVKDNAITRLSEALVKVGAVEFPVHLNPITQEYFRRSAAVTGGTMGRAMAAIAANPADNQAARVLSEDPRYNSQLRTTCVATMLEGGHARNALPQRARANVNCRILPNEDATDVRRILERAIGDAQVAVTPEGEARNSPPSPLTPGLMTRIEKISQDLWPGVPVIPTMSTGATDGLYLRNAGIPTYGVSGLFYPNTGAHGMNERVPAQAFYEGLEFMYRLVKSLATAGVS
jgi:acetylornithine deacetylase/succinyl-diaminopimelate desuccinylase-like protein